MTNIQYTFNQLSKCQSSNINVLQTTNENQWESDTMTGQCEFLLKINPPSQIQQIRIGNVNVPRITIDIKEDRYTNPKTIIHENLDLINKEEFLERGESGDVFKEKIFFCNLQDKVAQVQIILENPHEKFRHIPFILKYIILEKDIPIQNDNQNQSLVNDENINKKKLQQKSFDDLVKSKKNTQKVDAKQMTLYSYNYDSNLEKAKRQSLMEKEEDDELLKVMELSKKEEQDRERKEKEEQEMLIQQYSKANTTKKEKQIIEDIEEIDVNIKKIKISNQNDKQNQNNLDQKHNLKNEQFNKYDQNKNKMEVEQKNGVNVSPKNQSEANKYINNIYENIKYSDLKINNQAIEKKSTQEAINNLYKNQNMNIWNTKDSDKNMEIEIVSEAEMDTLTKEQNQKQRNNFNSHFQIESHMLSERAFKWQRQQEVMRNIPDKHFLFKKTLKNILKDKNITISGYESDNRQKIKDLIEELGRIAQQKDIQIHFNYIYLKGGRFNQQLNETVHYMIASDTKTKKYNEYLRNKNILSKLRIVNVKFLQDCKSMKKIPTNWEEYKIS